MQRHRSSSKWRVVFRPQLEQLEDRLVPSVALPTYQLLPPNASPSSGDGPGGGLTPTQIRHAYGFDQVTFGNGSVPANGAGETIAIVDAYNDPNIQSDLATFDSEFNLAPPPSFRVVNQTGGSTLPSNDTTGWALEISLDVEWAHAVAPGANILLVEANTNNFSDLLQAVSYAAGAPGVVAVSMSWGGGEDSSETGEDSTFTTPADHPGVTFLASSGDNGSPSGYPATSPNVIGVGGTTLTVDASGDWQSETAWSDSGGGPSSVETEPTYQSASGVVPASMSQGMRGVPDVAYDANPSTGFSVYDSWPYPVSRHKTEVLGWVEVGGTSAGSPQWAGLIAVADQGRALAGLGSLDGPTQTLSALYNLPASDFHDITSGSNGTYSAGPGYDLVTGRGSPYANLVIAGLVAQPPGPADSPLAPTNLEATPGNSTVTLNWTASAGATGYTIYRSTVSGMESAGAPIATLTSGTATSFTDTGLSNGTTYYYEVGAISGSTQGPLSAEVHATPELPPPVVENVQIDDGTGQASMVRSLTVTFNEQVALSSAFEVQRTTGAPLNLPLVLTAPITEGIAVSTSLNAQGETVATITFQTVAGGDTITPPLDPSAAGPYGSLPDGNYLLTVFAAGVSSSGLTSQTMAANSYTTFYRLFGDAVGGNRLVNAADLRQFDASLNNSSDYQSIFDYNGDGVVNAADLRQFDARLNNTQFPSAPAAPSALVQSAELTTSLGGIAGTLAQPAGTSESAGPSQTPASGTDLAALSWFFAHHELELHDPPRQGNYVRIAVEQGESSVGDLADIRGLDLLSFRR